MAEEKFIDKLKTALDNLVTLQIVTSVGKVSVTYEDKKISSINIGEGNQSIVSQFDLLQGDITTAFDSGLMTDAMKDLRDFHTSREKEGLQRVKDNIDALKELFNLSKQVEREEQDPGQPAEGNS